MAPSIGSQSAANAPTTPAAINRQPRILPRILVGDADDDGDNGQLVLALCLVNLEAGILNRLQGPTVRMAAGSQPAPDGHYRILHQRPPAAVRPHVFDEAERAAGLQD